MAEEPKITVTKGVLCVGDEFTVPAKFVTRGNYSMLAVSLDLGNLPPFEYGDDFQWEFLPEN